LFIGQREMGAIREQDHTMSIMAYCFETTAADLMECAEHIDDSFTSMEELAARLQLIRACKLVLEAVGFTIDLRREPIEIDDDLSTLLRQ
jgi:hypothetical protein